MRVEGFREGSEYDSAEVGVINIATNVDGEALLRSQVFDMLNEVSAVGEHDAA